MTKGPTFRIVSQAGDRLVDWTVCCARQTVCVAPP